MMVVTLVSGDGNVADIVGAWMGMLDNGADFGVMAGAGDDGIIFDGAGE